MNENPNVRNLSNRTTIIGTTVQTMAEVAERNYSLSSDAHVITTVTEQNTINGEAAQALGEEYKQLLTAAHFSEQDETRVNEILELAEDNDEVDFWISHFDAELAMKSGKLSEASQQNFETQKVLLREHLGNPNFPPGGSGPDSRKAPKVHAGNAEVGPSPQ